MAEQGPPQVLQGLYKTFEVIDLGNTGSTESRIVSLNLETSVLVHVQNKVFWPWTVFFFSTCEGRSFLENCQHICYCIFNMQQQEANFQWSVTLSVTHLCDRFLRTV